MHQQASRYALALPAPSEAGPGIPCQPSQCGPAVAAAGAAAEEGMNRVLHEQEKRPKAWPFVGLYLSLLYDAT